MQISRYWFRTRIEKGYPKTNLSLFPKYGYQIRCKCEKCNEEFNRTFGLNDFQFCAGCRLGKRSKTSEARERASKLFSNYYALEENRIKKSKAVKELYKNPDYALKQKLGSQIRSLDPIYIQKLRSDPNHGKKVSCGYRKIALQDFDEFIADKDLLERQRCRDSVGRECFEKATYKCDICNSGGILHAHHMNGWHWAITERFDLNNLVCLCHGCHISFHIEYGKRNNTKAQYQEFKLSQPNLKV